MWRLSFLMLGISFFEGLSIWNSLYNYNIVPSEFITGILSLFLCLISRAVKITKYWAQFPPSEMKSQLHRFSTISHNYLRKKSSMDCCWVYINALLILLGSNFNKFTICWFHRHIGCYKFSSGYYPLSYLLGFLFLFINQITFTVGKKS